ncbi:MFS transporter [Aliiglaciecola sp. 2_MG-2023]|uniref:spinster family MFS transporter n=1 Tax=unclassified Aliiglaciecola TaxID=2593648 RepID=UPI0026E373FB|nr:MULTISPECIES: MFS transporter [unclassified Aliiglaciecola]MDO6711687.1 MFS transporter [Aliiglaciecola sp. 2_MG-2023]MDO6752758.1 MFS transporter [Aliiglaciecola sp. 1_MG-2023]
MTEKTLSKVESSAILSESPKQSIYAAYLIFILLLAYTFSFIDRQILSLLVEPMKRDLDISDTQMSLLQGLSFALFYTLMGLPLGRLADSKSRRGIIAWSIFIWSLMTAACGLAKSYWSLFFARMGVGVGEAGLSPAAYSLIADSVPKKHLAKAIGVYTMGIYLGGGMALIVGGMVIQWASTFSSISLPIIGEVYAWQAVFLAVGLPGLLLVPFLFTLKEPARSEKQEKAVPVAEVVQFFKNNKKTILLHNFGAALASVAGYGALAWVPSYLIRVHGMDSGEVGLAFGLIVLICGAGGVIAGGIAADRRFRKGQTDAKMRVAMWAMIIGIIPTLIYPLISDLTVVLLILAISTFFANFMMGLGPAAIQEVVPSNMRGQFSALYLFIVNLIGLGLGPTLVALSTDYIFGSPEMVGYSLLLVSFFAMAGSALLLGKCLPHYRATLVSLEESSTK